MSTTEQIPANADQPEGTTSYVSPLREQYDKLDAAFHAAARALNGDGGTALDDVRHELAQLSILIAEAEQIQDDYSDDADDWQEKYLNAVREQTTAPAPADLEDRIVTRVLHEMRIWSEVHRAKDRADIIAALAGEVTS